MHNKNGILTRGAPPKNVGRQRGTSVKRPQEIIKHRPFATRAKSQAGNIDALLKGGTISIAYGRTMGGLGDIIMMTPIARGAKKKYPNCHVTCFVDTESYNGDLANVLLYNPYIDEIVDYRTIRKDDYHIFSDITKAGLQFELPYTVFPNRIDLFARAAKIPLFGQPTPILVLSEAEEQFGRTFVDNNVGAAKPAGKIAVHIRSNDPKRTWPQANLLKFLNLAHQNNYHCFLFGWHDNPNEWNLPGVTQVFDYNIRHAAAILKECDVLVCPDSSMLHVGGALNMKMVTLFGSMPPACRINHYHNAIAIINQKIPCIGCVYSACNNRFYCMQSIFPEVVLKAVRQKLRDEHVPLNSSEVYPAISEEDSFDNVVKEVGTVEL